MVLSGASAPLALWYVPVPEIGGVARHALDAVRTGIPGFRIVVLCPEGPLAAQLRALGAAVLTGPVSPADGARTAIAEVRRVLSRLRPDVLHTHLAFADIAGAAAVTGLRSGAGRRIRLVSTEHGISPRRGYYQSSAAGAAVKAAAHRARLHRTDRVIAVSQATAREIRRQWGSGAPVSVIRNGVDAPAQSAAREPGLRVLSLARLAPEKRIDALLEAFALVHASHSEARLTIAGEGEREAALRELARRLGLAGGEEASVSFPGHVDAAEALAAHDVVVQLSDSENLSYTLLDAVASGLGVVATPVGGNAEIVPARCLVYAANSRGVAAAILAQGLDVTARPRPGEDDQSVAGMCTAIGREYREALA
ncbi:glycosyltransferase [Brachybacterium sp. JHP9]|uniref:D-inositol 3-phosphate glycosyltransferase n=1 Tax=Brachybacterium equifaecis TaxID=2910770 RepID=A0ABT0R005_9MICO|nr:glycosyltransferase [Brachybacterium equifaecis]